MPIRQESPGAARAASGVFAFGALLALACFAIPARAQHHGAPAVTRWGVLLDASASLLYVNEGTKRGDSHFALADWEMLRAILSRAKGSLHLTAMTTVSPFVNGGKGVPQLLQTGGSYRHAWVHDRRHPMPAVMELGATYHHFIRSGLQLSLAAGAVGQPALGPAPYFHRGSGENDPLAPLGHHWQDASHSSFGVVTGGIAAGHFLLEGSAFNAREANETHPVVDYRGARLDSYAGRVTWAPDWHLRVSGWSGYLNEPHRLDPTTRMHRFGASVTTATLGLGGGRWSSLAMWGMNVHHHGASSHALIHGSPGASPHHESRSVLVESNLDIGENNAVFARLEHVEKNGEELGFLGGDLTTLYDIRSAVLGGTWSVANWGRATFAIGARGSVNFVPEELRATYGTLTPKGFSVFVRIRQHRVPDSL